MDSTQNAMQDFDALSRLAKESPETFENYRQSLIDELIDNLPNERRGNMRRFQWKIDQVRKTHRTPMGVCVKLSGMMWDSFQEMREHVRVLDDFFQSHDLHRPMYKAEVIEFKPGRTV